LLPPLNDPDEELLLEEEEEPIEDP